MKKLIVFLLLSSLYGSNVRANSVCVDSQQFDTLLYSILVQCPENKHMQLEAIDLLNTYKKEKMCWEQEMRHKVLQIILWTYNPSFIKKVFDVLYDQNFEFGNKVALSGQLQFIMTERWCQYSPEEQEILRTLGKQLSQ
jgi:hypothetical protein